MEVGTLVAYTLTFIALLFSITAWPQVIIGGLIGKLAGPLVGGLIGSIIAWHFVDWLWVAFEGGHVPIVALIGALVFIVGHGFISRGALTKQSNGLMAAEQWAIILIGISLFVQSETVRWY